MMGHHQDPHRPSSDGDGDNGGGESGPTPNHNKANKMPCYNLYSDAVVHPATGDASVVRTLQPFDISTNSPAAGVMGYPFTWAQWKELEMQNIIYKYIVSAISVPQDLLLSICTNSSGALHSASHTTSVQGQRYTNIRDLEPGRCKRTDGKKWRCSRDVAPNQKYCERHMHRGRPARSRKHVEVHGDVNNKKKRLQPAPLESTPVVVPIPTPVGQSNKPLTKQPVRSTCQQIQGPLFFHDKMEEYISTDPFLNELYRNSGWMMEGELVAKVDDAGQQWQHLMDSSAGYSADAMIHPDLQHGYREEALNLLACSDMERAEDVSVKHNGEFNFMINPELVSMGKQSAKEAPRDLINAWSNDSVYNNGNTENMEASLWPPQGNISPSSLTLSIAMAAGDALDEDMGLDSRFMNANQHKSWENSWVPFASGGPLAEVLHPSSSYTSNGDSISPAATTVSSPSGVLQKTLFAHSDSSVCNSPILAAPTNTSETVPFQWLRIRE
ncbi:growth-regulating factor 2-like isoform X1 [Lycium barbarum]|uniref:growth-regulating factor 2-like isoform X1 n=1 Tax=Lycium barbarum TaxID=112863 RepID=UPI00293E0E6C|nr:growth-regulating factor 2-like isoform X1 [Lycium barbarum]